MFPIFHLIATLLVYIVAIAWLDIHILSWPGIILLLMVLVSGFLIDIDHSGLLKDKVVCTVKMDSGARECVDVHRGIIHQHLFGYFLLFSLGVYCLHQFMDSRGFLGWT